MQRKLLKRTRTLKSECVGGLIRGSAASLNTRGYLVSNRFVLLFLVFIVSLSLLLGVLRNETSCCETESTRHRCRGRPTLINVNRQLLTCASFFFSFHSVVYTCCCFFLFHPRRSSSSRKQKVQLTTPLFSYTEKNRFDTNAFTHMFLSV